MQKRNLKHAWTRKLVTVGLSAAMIAPSFSSVGMLTALAEEPLPVPVGFYEAGEAVDTDTTDVDPTVVDADDLWEGAKAWKLGATVAAEPDANGITKNADSAVSVENPLLNNPNIVEEVTLSEEGRPMWSTAATITYWVKCASNKTNPSSLISFKSEGVQTTHKDDLMKHVTYTALSEYKAGDENNPESEFYCKVLDEKVKNAAGREFDVYDFYAYAQAKRVEDLNSFQAIPALVVYSPNYKGGFYVYVGAHDETGNPAEPLELNKNCVKISDFLYSATKADMSAKLEEWKDFAVLNKGQVRYGYENSFLQLCTDNALVFTQDANECKLYKDEVEVEDGKGGAQPKNSLYYQHDTAEYPVLGKTPADDTEWHYVAFVLKNDVQYVYIDGEPASESYDLTEAFSFWYDNQSFNCGTGLVNSQGNWPALGADWKYSNPNANAMSMLEWLSTAQTLNIGGASIGTSATWTQFITGTVADTQIASVKVYDTELTEEDIVALYNAKGDAPTEKPTDTPAPSEDPKKTYKLGDVDLDNDVTAKDALVILQHVVKLTDISKQEDGDVKIILANADEDAKGDITAKDALVVLQTVVKLIGEKEITL